MNTMPNLAHFFARTVFAVAVCALWSGQAALAETPSSAAQASAKGADDEAPQEAPDARIGKGDVTRVWLNAQASRQQSSRTRQTLSGPVMSTVHERYVKSFSDQVERTPLRADMAPTTR